MWALELNYEPKMTKKKVENKQRELPIVNYKESSVCLCRHAGFVKKRLDLGSQGRLGLVSPVGQFLGIRAQLQILDTLEPLWNSWCITNCKF